MAINSYSTIHIVSDAPFWCFGEHDNDCSGVNLGTCTTFGCRKQTNFTQRERDVYLIGV